MPYTLAAMAAGVLSEHRARIVVQEICCLTRRARAEIDRHVCGDLSRLETLGTRRLGNLARGEAARRDPAGVTARLGHAAADRFVSLRPAPDCMARLTALLPVAQGVSVYAALRTVADTARATGDPRTRGQVMADDLVMRVTGQGSPDAIPVALHLIMPATTLLGTGVRNVALTGDGASRPHRDGSGHALTGDGSGDDPTAGAGDLPGRILGWGPVPAPVARHLVGAAPRVGSWIRRLWAAPSGGLIAMESRRRLFPRGLGEFISIRDDLCRTPFCDAPIRHIDHITPRSEGGQTSAANGQGLCERCNHTKQAPGWTQKTPPNRARARDTPVDPDEPTPGTPPTPTPTTSGHHDPPTRDTGPAAAHPRPRRRLATPDHRVTLTTPTGHHYPSPDTTSP